MTEQEIIKDCIAGRARGQKALYDLYYRKMYGVCLRYSRDTMQAEDFLQEAFIRVYKNIAQFRLEGSFEGWIRRIVVNVCLEMIRKEKSMLFIDGDERNYDFGDDPVSDKFNTQHLLKAIQELSEGYRTVFNLFAIEGYSHKEIADMLGISEGTSKSQFARARQSLQLKLNMVSSVKTNAHVR